MSPIPKEVVDAAAWVDVDEVDTHGDNLTEWEIEYLDSLKKQLKQGRTLTKKQLEKLEDIRRDRL